MVRVPTPSLPTRNRIHFLFIYVLKEHVLASQRGPAAAEAIEGGVEPTGMT